MSDEYRDHCKPNCSDFDRDNGDCKESRTPCSRPELNECRCYGDYCFGSEACEDCKLTDSCYEQTVGQSWLHVLAWWVVLVLALNADPTQVCFHCTIIFTNRECTFCTNWEFHHTGKKPEWMEAEK